MSVGKLYSMDPAVTTRVVALRLQHFSVTFADATAHYTHTSQRSSDDGQSLLCGKLTCTLHAHLPALKR